MILTIKGADFSSANIGTLSTYVVSKSIGRGATYEIPGFISKNSSANWTITLEEGYIFGTYSVTMGGEPVEVSVTDNVMTISIAEVTGNVRIVVATVNENTGEEDEPDTPTPDEPTVYTLTSDDVELGGWGTYEKMDATNRIRTKELINVSAGCLITIDKPDNLEICVSVLLPDGTTTAKDNNWVVRELWSQNKTITVPSDGFLHLVWKRSDEKTMSLSDWSGTYTYTK